MILMGNVLNFRLSTSLFFQEMIFRFTFLGKDEVHSLEKVHENSAEEKCRFYQHSSIRVSRFRSAD